MDNSRLDHRHDAPAIEPGAEFLPLLPTHNLDRVLIQQPTRTIHRIEFLRDVLAVAESLPQTNHLLNLCTDRYWFSVALFAAIVRNIVTVLPNSSAANHTAELLATISDLVCIGDQDCAPPSNMPYVRVDQRATTDSVSDAPSVPQIRADQKIVCVFTSGSTGRPTPHFKTFGKVYRSIVAGSERIWQLAGGPCSVVGTVPLRHMYGLESTVLLPIFADGQLSTAMPFFPAEIAAALRAAPAPRLLVISPFHLRNLLDAAIELPPMSGILSATAPLSTDLAAAAEAQLNAPLLEIYGSTETGQLAMRRPTSSDEWETLPGITLHAQDGATIASSVCLEHTQALNDIVELHSATRFKLIDRHANIINVAGKRSSLAFLNHTLSNIPGVQEGAFCIPEDHASVPVMRLAAVIVAPTLQQADIIAALRQHIDPLFLPRPVVFVDALPRDGNGKIRAAALHDLIRAHRSKKT